jgi:hypothetical protein
MTAAQIFITAYLFVGLLAAILIGTTLIASKRKDQKTDNKMERPTYDSLPARPFHHEPKTKPSRFRL